MPAGHEPLRVLPLGHPKNTEPQQQESLASQHLGLEPRRRLTPDPMPAPTRNESAIGNNIFRILFSVIATPFHVDSFAYNAKVS